ncbi:AraC family transcriptional regulator [Amphritea balenae]|uniref:AraC family transcriptional regulator n=1 Tax=Amphritea balenae TaxID=452629 RepID=A0A3P1SS53_9GAMM|nr:AraC family transcriptional regulator [Amphritea balenae]RRD00009.1 AraC family transcriptional regulator [Amphritea balenae]GGK75836.1 AraC family transcriptional regulator [Amphritea balenae]
MQDLIAYHRLTDTPDLVLSEGLYSEYRFEPHYHIDYHIGLVVEGVQRQKFQGNTVRLAPGRISVMPPGAVHDGISDDQNAYRMNTFRISPELISHYFTDIYEQETDLLHSGTLFSGAMIENRLISNQLSQIFKLLQSDGTLSSVASEQNWLNALAPLLAQLYQQTPKPVKGGLSDKDIYRIREYCHAYLGEKISLEQLAGLCGLSRYQFLRRFEKTCGITPHAWLTRLRLEYACRKIRCSDSTIAQIATDTGFYDQSHFNRAFRQAYGAAPSRY